MECVDRGKGEEVRENEVRNVGSRQLVVGIARQVKESRMHTEFTGSRISMLAEP